ncbi:MAG: 4-(cytidine 5'-diphospho)-2-C-methyl-D-erythritol kinase [Ignavibacteria bacterium CG_4_8_14_3_um_filter_37_9]|nr:4-(cytidine 5'-diphospho)-2-C-methyl-D-erythritol kinase [Ignavibacteria bacterium]PIP79740.1 MAG: 4-(cytidine 5'-diphospho)-2-C-methyl-D-erythritol kinase [Ignavibacteria bacterium CG22_combo_CG10-13_8_21_14_all_37_15]PIS45258.1 MAG: 4-(cytidine 5'-diphospho)-2-C-methyl-D-erythritol kinase [Ignavibacteria bacterium CG08_land_8_20_14_0_20_37_9]PIW99639.1 MAG: 4-(cytidine 5'-diphospho)-2-C-methyl-D-erythritol kinase [Ignavibacteria bacterium CG_4_8_14_3_um_filter_37_9]PIX94485.1 MAG: 4-(cytid
MKKIIINSPAKINFGLNIVSKRNDGFHNIETIFYPIELHDILTFERAERFSFSCNNELILNDNNNLVLKAIRLLEQHSKMVFNAAITLEKNIPIGAGLGGGSSNAANTLLAVNELFDLQLKEGLLKEFAFQLGSDVPFFLHPVSSFASSRGEMLWPISFRIAKPILLVNPGIHISTKWAYENILPKVPDFSLSSLDKNSVEHLTSLQNSVVNDFEKVTFAAHPELNKIKTKMFELHAEFALMSGSGSTLFGIFPDKVSARLAKKYFSKTYFTYLQ